MAGRNDQLDGHHALVTGGGSGIGAATAIALARQGAKVSVAGRRSQPLETILGRLGAGAGSFCAMDVTSETSVANGIAAVIEVAGQIDVLVNNAGRASSAPFDQTGPELWHEMLAVNLTGAYLVTRAVLPGMTARRSGRIINVASTAGLTGYSYVSAYVAAKHGLVGLTRALALEAAGNGITVNAVCPGFTDTPLLAGAIETIRVKTGRSVEEARAKLAKSNPMDRLVSPDEVADAIVWLASPGAVSVNGQCIVVAGGEVMAG